MENVTTTIQDKEPLIFTDSAAEKVKKLIEEEKNPLFKTHKLIYPSEDEVIINIRSRSSKMRVIEKLWSF